MTQMVILGEAWGSHEAARKAPFVGPSGHMLNDFCEGAGLIPIGSARRLARDWHNMNLPMRDAIYREAGIHLTNVLNMQPPGNNIEALCVPKWGNLPSIRQGKYLAPQYIHHLDRLRGELDEHQPNLILGLGSTAAWFALGSGAITKLRGAIAPSRYGKFLPTFHPAYLMRGQRHLRPVVQLDFEKAARERHFPDVRRPERFIYIPEEVTEIDWAIREMANARYLSVDIETVEDQITCIGFAWSTEHALVIPIWDFSKSDRSYWGHNEEVHVWHRIRDICGMPIPKVFQNGLYDIHFLWRRYGIMPANCEHDTMLLHHALQPEMQKGLGFLGSLYTNEPAWKLMRPKGKGTIKREDE
jgi:uracil-DNA glycosylase